MFRYTLKTQSELVTINDELGHVQDYVSIQQIRFDNRFQLIIDIPQELRTCKVLKLILQPLVENALYHGLNYCTAGDTISISGNSDGQYIYLNVHDNGQGMSPETVAQLEKSLGDEHSSRNLDTATSRALD